MTYRTIEIVKIVKIVYFNLTCTIFDIKKSSGDLTDLPEPNKNYSNMTFFKIIILLLKVKFFIININTSLYITV